MRAVFAFLGTLGVVLALAAATASGITRPQTFSLLEIDQSDASVNLGFDFQRAPRPGDQFAFKSDLYKWAGTHRGAAIGHDVGHCTFIEVPADLQHQPITGHCAAGMFLPSGQVLIEGFIRFSDGPSKFDVPVVGGTGAYANARGYVHIEDIGSGDSGHSSLTFHLLP